METVDTKQEQKSNSVLYITIILLLISLCYIVYLYLSYEIIKKDQLEDKYVLKSNIDTSIIPDYETTNNTDSYKYTTQIASLKKQIQQLQKNSTSANNIQTIEVEKIVQVERIIERERLIDTPLSNERIKAIQSKGNFNTYICKNMASGSIEIPQKCKNNLYKFLEKNTKSKMFEVIGMKDNKDFKLLNKLKDVYGEKKIRHLSKYSQIGLSRQRVIEASWLMKKYLGKYENIKAVNYTINKKGQKGFIVRAYY